MADDKMTSDDTTKPDSHMPAPPDLTSLFDAQKTKISDAYKASSDAFKVFAARDAALTALTNVYNAEIIKVFGIAKMVTTPPTALASVPLVLAAANEALIQATVTDQTATSAIEAAFSEFKS